MYRRGEDRSLSQPGEPVRVPAQLCYGHRERRSDADRLYRDWVGVVLHSIVEIMKACYLLAIDNVAVDGTGAFVALDTSDLDLASLLVSTRLL